MRSVHGLRRATGGSSTLMSGPVVVFSIVIAAVWVWSLFFDPQARCTRCTGGRLHFGSSGLCRKCGGTGRRERRGVGALRALGWEIGPAGRLRRRGAPGGRKGPGRADVPGPADPGDRSGRLSWSFRPRLFQTHGMGSGTAPGTSLYWRRTTSVLFKKLRNKFRMGEARAEAKAGRASGNP